MIAYMVCVVIACLTILYSAHKCKGWSGMLDGFNERLERSGMIPVSVIEMNIILACTVIFAPVFVVYMTFHAIKKVMVKK